MPKASDNLFPYVHLVPAAAPASPAAGAERIYLDSGDGNKLKRKDSSGTVTTVEGGGSGGVGDHGARVKKDTTGQVIGTGGTPTALTWQTEDWDTDGYWTSGAPTKFTIPTGMGGKYLVGGGYTFDSATAFDQIASISVNGTELLSTRSRQGSASAVNRTSTILNLAAGDYVEMLAYQASGSNKTTATFAANMAEFFIQKLA
jgi:hypothetical protein